MTSRRHSDEIDSTLDDATAPDELAADMARAVGEAARLDVLDAFRAVTPPRGVTIPSPQDLIAMRSAVADLQAHRLRFFGVNDGNGAFGTLQREVAAIRGDLGGPEERRAVSDAVKLLRAGRIKIAALASALLLAIGGSARVWIVSHDDATARSIRLELRVQRCEDALGLSPLRSTP